MIAVGAAGTSCNCMVTVEVLPFWTRVPGVPFAVSVTVLLPADPWKEWSIVADVPPAETLSGITSLEVPSPQAYT